MGFQIENGMGTGGLAEVKNNKLLVSGVVATPEGYVTHHEGNSFNVLFSATPSGANDCFFYMKNTNNILDITIVGIWIKMEIDDSISINLNCKGTPIGATDITPVNCNTESGKIAQGVFLQGNQITGLSGGATVWKTYYSNSKQSLYINFNQDIVLKPNGTFTLRSGIGTVPIEGMLEFNYHNGIF